MSICINKQFIDALYTINKLAKIYEQQSTKNVYLSNFTSARKDSLYNYKKIILLELYNQDKLYDYEIHRIKNNLFICFYLTKNYNFHIPKKQIKKELDINKSIIDISHSYSKTIINENNLPMSEKRALVFLQKKFESINNYLVTDFVTVNFKKKYIGWEYLEN